MHFTSEILILLSALTSLTVSAFAASADPGKVINAYLEVQTALAKDDLAAAQKAAKSVEEAATDDSTKEIQSAAKEVGEAKDIKAARKAFGVLSEKTISFAKSNKAATGGALYVAYCPMALNGGADWLQTTKKIANPYYGASMLTCGGIKETLAE